MRNILEKSLINKSGIYMIVNLVNKKFYVGSATSNKLHIRFKAHLLYCIGSDIIAKAVEKSGLSASKPVTAYSIDGSVYRNEPSMIKLGVYLGVNPKTLRLAIRSGKLVKKK